MWCFAKSSKTCGKHIRKNIYSYNFIFVPEVVSEPHYRVNQKYIFSVIQKYPFCHLPNYA